MIREAPAETERPLERRVRLRLNRRRRELIFATELQRVAVAEILGRATVDAGDRMMRPPRIVRRRNSAPTGRKTQVRHFVGTVRGKWKQPLDVQPGGLQVITLQDDGILVFRAI